MSDGWMGMTKSFAVTWDYRCPFARNAHEHVVTGLEAGADWDVTFLPFSLGQAHVEEGTPDVWEHPEQDSGILALQVGVEVRDVFPDHFLSVHRALFAARHDKGLHIEDPDVLHSILTEVGADADAVFGAIEGGAALERVRNEHVGFARSHDVWGVPTFITGDHAAFVRLMNRPDASDAQASIDGVERIVGLLGGWPELNEFKHTSLQR